MTPSDTGFRLHFQHAKGKAEHRDFLTRAEGLRQRRRTCGALTVGELVATITQKPGTEAGRKLSRDARARLGVTKADVRFK